MPQSSYKSRRWSKWSKHVQHPLLGSGPKMPYRQLTSNLSYSMLKSNLTQPRNVLPAEKKIGGWMCIHELIPVLSSGTSAEKLAFSVRSSPSSVPSFRKWDGQAKYTGLCIPCHMEFFQVLKSFLSPYDKGLEGLRLFVLKRRQIGSLMINVYELMNERDKVHLVFLSSLPCNTRSPLWFHWNSDKFKTDEKKHFAQPAYEICWSQELRKFQRHLYQ